METFTGWLSALLCVAGVAALVSALGDRFPKGGKPLRLLCGLSVLAALLFPLGNGFLPAASEELTERLFPSSLVWITGEADYSPLLRESTAILTERCMEAIAREWQLTEADLSLSFSVCVEDEMLKVPSVTAELKTVRAIAVEGQLRDFLGDYAEAVTLWENIGEGGITKS